MHVIKSLIHLLRQSLYCKSKLYADNLQLKHGKPLNVYPCWTSKSVVHTLMKPLKQYLHTVPKIRFMYSQKWSFAASFPIPTFMYLCPVMCNLYIPRKIGRLILGIYKTLTHTWMWKLWYKTLYFCFGNNEAAQFHFLEYINPNQTFISNSHKPFICSSWRPAVFQLISLLNFCYRLIKC
jgi:hypothetical protein